MNLWDSNLFIGDPVTVEAAQTTRDKRTREIVVQRFDRPGKVITLDLVNGHAVGVRFDDGEVLTVHASKVRKVEPVKVGDAQC